jgi:hypothetical protein
MPAFDDFRTKAYPYRFNVALVVDSLAGGTPTDPKVAEGWLRSKLEATDDTIRRMVAEVMTDRGVTWDEAAEVVNADRNLTGFKRDAQGLFVDGRTIKAMLKEASSIAANAGKITASRVWGKPTDKNYLKGLKAWFPEHVFVPEEKVYILDGDDRPVTEPTEVVQRFVHANGRSAISYTEVMAKARLKFTVITDHAFTDEQWAAIWLTGEQNGLGASRSQGFGRFVVTDWSPIG